MLQYFQRRAGVSSRRPSPILLALLHTADEHKPRRHAKGGENDGKSAKSPSPSRVVEEVGGDLRPAEDGRDGWRQEDAPQQASVPKRRDIRENDRDDIAEADVSDPVDRVRCSVHFDALASGFEDGPEEDEGEHEEEAFDSAPDVNHFGEEEVAHATADGSDDTDDSCQTMLVESGRDVRVQVRLDSR